MTRSASCGWSARNFGFEKPPLAIPITAFVSSRASVAVRAISRPSQK
jgi:hypothetical protein